MLQQNYLISLPKENFVAWYFEIHSKSSIHVWDLSVLTSSNLFYFKLRQFLLQSDDFIVQASLCFRLLAASLTNFLFCLSPKGSRRINLGMKYRRVMSKIKRISQRSKEHSMQRNNTFGMEVSLCEGSAFISWDCASWSSSGLTSLAPSSSTIDSSSAAEEVVGASSITSLKI